MCPAEQNNEDPPESPGKDSGAPDVRKSSYRRIDFPVDTRDTSDDWVTSYADMATLLLTLFVTLLLNTSTTEPGGPAGSTGQGARSIIEDLLNIRISSPYLDGEVCSACAAGDVQINSSDGASVAIVKNEDLERIRTRERALVGIREALQTAKLDSYVSAGIEGDGIRLNIPNSILFASGASDLAGGGRLVIRALGPILAATEFVVSVEGHTDNVPIQTPRYPSNWELSAQRAATVVRTLVESGMASSRLEAVGYGESRPLADNATEDGRAENRRVTLFLRTPT